MVGLVGGASDTTVLCCRRAGGRGQDGRSTARLPVLLTRPAMALLLLLLGLQAAAGQDVLAGGNALGNHYCIAGHI